MRLQIRTAVTFQALEFAASIQVPPGQERSGRRHRVHSCNVLVTFGRYQTLDGRQPQLGTDFARW